MTMIVNYDDYDAYYDYVADADGDSNDANDAEVKMMRRKTKWEML
jgi:hypothetical protein